MTSLHSPWFLLALLLLPAAWWPWLDARRRVAIVFSDVARLKAATRGRRAAFRWLLPILRTASMALLVIALARPQQGNEQTRIDSEGIAIQLVCDISGSMNALDYEMDGRPQSRVAVVKNVVKDFVRGNGRDLPGRPNDLIGLITFARYADSVCPLTFDHANLVGILDKVRARNDIAAQQKMWDLQLEYRRKKNDGASESELRELEAAFSLVAEEDGTSIGDAIGLGLERLNQATRGIATSGKKPIKSRVLILMTDGKQTMQDSLDPIEAAKIAVPLGIRIHTISVGRATQVAVQRWNPQTAEAQLVSAEFEVDEETLQKVAEATGGKFFRASDTEALRDIYREIDRLERTRTDEKRYMQYTEKSGPWLLAAFVGLALEMCLAGTLLRRIP